MNTRDVHIDIPQFAEYGMTVRFHRRSRLAFRKRFSELTGRTFRTRTGEGESFKIDPSLLEEVRKLIEDEYPRWEIKVNDRTLRYIREGARVGWSREAGDRFSYERWNGFVSTVHIFMIERFYQSGERRYSGKMVYRLRSTIGLFGDQPHDGPVFDEIEEAQEKAEEVLVSFIESLGASFPESPEERS